ncbi:MAG: hypothetical protein LBR43_03980, partial [Spiroplasmataceae bacterium]|nr:hypothetical protein [Spiroplasmataceae bacterium]
AIYFSPNQGGNEHAPLSYADKIDKDSLRLEKDNQGQVQQNQEKINPKAKPNDYNSWLIGGGTVLAGILVAFLIINFRKKGTKNKITNSSN